MFIPPSVGGMGWWVGGSGQCTIVWGGKLFISTQYQVAESVFCWSFKFWLNFRFVKIHGFDLIIFFRRNLGKNLKLIHKLAWTVGCQNPKFQNFDQTFLASTALTQNASKTAKKWVNPPFSLLSKQDRLKRSLALRARSRLAVLFWWLCRGFVVIRRNVWVNTSNN